MCSIVERDSAVEVDTFFEGTEKLLEVWFNFDTSENLNNNDLRLIPRATLDAVLDHIKAKIINHSKSQYWDGYVLSESSLFVSQDKIILKTCGSTTLLLGLQPIIEAAYKHTSANTVAKLFYSRKSMLKPDQQYYPHLDFDSETDFLTKYFPTGLSHTFGENLVDKNNEWVVFVYENPSTDACCNVNNSNTDCTVELLMSDLDVNSAKNFFKCQPNGANTSQVDFSTNTTTATTENALDSGYGPELSSSKCPLSSASTHPPPTGDSMLYRSGLVECFNKCDTVNYAEFDPLGLSVNVINNKTYHTIHVTPQQLCSYASYETNLWNTASVSHLRNVINVFNPKSFVMNAFVYSQLESPESFHSQYHLDHFDYLNVAGFQLFYGFYVRCA